MAKQIISLILSVVSRIERKKSLIKIPSFRSKKLSRIVTLNQFI